MAADVRRPRTAPPDGYGRSPSVLPPSLPPPRPGLIRPDRPHSQNRIRREPELPAPSAPKHSNRRGSAKSTGSRGRTMPLPQQSVVTTITADSNLTRAGSRSTVTSRPLRGQPGPSGRRASARPPSRAAARRARSPTAGSRHHERALPLDKEHPPTRAPFSLVHAFDDGISGGREGQATRAKTADCRPGYWVRSHPLGLGIGKALLVSPARRHQWVLLRLAGCVLSEAFGRSRGTV